MACDQCGVWLVTVTQLIFIDLQNERELLFCNFLRHLSNKCQVVEKAKVRLRRSFSRASRAIFNLGSGTGLPACRRLLFPLLHAEKGRLRNAVANRVPASRWQGILFRINCEIVSG